MKLNKMFKEFNTAFGLKEKDFNVEELRKSQMLIEEEVAEFDEELYDNDVESGVSYSECDSEQVRSFSLKNDAFLDKVNVVKELTDILYITMQQMTQLGLDVEACITEVHRSNMTKTIKKERIESELQFAKERYPSAVSAQVGDVFVMRDPTTNKIVKPQGYTPADMTVVL